MISELVLMRWRLREVSGRRKRISGSVEHHHDVGVAQPIPQALARLMLRFGRLTEEAHAWVSKEYP